MVLKASRQLVRFGMLNKLFFALVFTIIIVAFFLFFLNENKIVTFKEKDVIKITPNNCDSGNKKCLIESNEFSVEILFDENVYYLKPFNISVMNKSIDNIELESIKVNFKMNNMNMGVNRFRLKKVSFEKHIQIWKGEALLPICVTGRADWVSEFEITTKNNIYLISVPISVIKALN